MKLVFIFAAMATLSFAADTAPGQKKPATPPPPARAQSIPAERKVAIGAKMLRIQAAQIIQLQSQIQVLQAQLPSQQDIEKENAGYQGMVAEEQEKRNAKGCKLNFDIDWICLDSATPASPKR